ncbi:MAG: 50S ribosomal protein L5 [Candidatus Brockarchaeota archaeon]|nr:50S ribosomal protein L5 [Candidatus Brockarchaeota archaeon]
MIAATVEKGQNPMRRMSIGKVVVNIAVGRSGEPLEKAKTVLKSLVGVNPSERQAKKTIREFGIRKGEPIAVMATLRGGAAEAFLRRALQALGNRISASAFDDNGNFSFGLKEHIELPGVRYDPELGIYGMNVSVSIVRPGYRVALRRRRRAKVGARQRVRADEAIEFMRRFGAEIV